MSKAKFKKVPFDNYWRRFSVILWKNQKEAHRGFQWDFELGGTELLANLKKQEISSTVFWVMAIKNVIQKNPRFNRFILRDQIWTRDNIDALVRVSLKKEEGSLWGAYLRGLQDYNTLSLLQTRFNELVKKKLSNQSSTSLKKNLSFLSHLPIPSFIFRFFIGLLDFMINQKIKIPFLPDLIYPSFSISNLGTIKAPLLPILPTPLLVCPIQISVGQMKGTKVTMFLSFDHRLHDGPDVALFVAELEQELLLPKAQ